MSVQRITKPLQDILQVLYDAHTRDVVLHGWAIMEATKRPGPTVYRSLDRLEDSGWVTSRWENENPEPHRPRRRFYELTPTGVTQAHSILAERRPEALTPRERQITRPQPTFGAKLARILGAMR